MIDLSRSCIRLSEPLSIGSACYDLTHSHGEVELGQYLELDAIHPVLTAARQPLRDGQLVGSRESSVDTPPVSNGREALRYKACGQRRPTQAEFRQPASSVV